MSASLLPNGEQVFLSNAGVPLAAGKVFYYIPNTSTPKNTWQDAGELVLNTNPIILDSAGRCIAYGQGEYRQVVQDSFGNTIWDQLTQDLTSAIQSSVALFCGTSTGTANAQVVSPSPAVTSITTGQQFSFFAGLSNTGPMIIQISALVYALQFGGTDLPSGSVVAGAATLIEFDGTDMELINPYPLPIPGASGNLLQSNGTQWTSAAPLLPAPGGVGNVLTSNGSAWLSSAAALAYASAADTLLGTATNEAITPGGFAGNKSIGTNGYYKLPGGLIIQWGRLGTNIGNTTAIINFPLAFPNACFSVVCVKQENAGVNDGVYVYTPPTTLNFTVYAGGSGASDVYYIAIGN
jgi:tail fiber protein gp53